MIEHSTYLQAFAISITALLLIIAAGLWCIYDEILAIRITLQQKTRKDEKAD